MAAPLSDEERRLRRQRYNKTYKEKHPERVKATNQRYNNRPDVIERRKQWIAENEESYKASKRRYYERNKEKICEQAKEFARNNPSWKASTCAKRRARKLNATPSWLTDRQTRQIERFYHEARKLSEETGIQHDVDHIVPLQGRKVCGLHVPWNLQVIPCFINYRKHNKLDESSINQAA